MSPKGITAEETAVVVERTPEPIAKDEIWRALENLQGWVEARDYRGYEPFDGLSSWARAFTFRNQLAERILQQAIRQCPINLRPFFGIHPQDSTKGRGYMAWGYLALYKATRHQRFLDKATACLGWLDTHRVPRFRYHSWSNHFDFVSRGGSYTKDDPIIVWTSLIGHAYVDAFEITEKQWFLDIARSACNWILELPREQTPTGDCISYLAHVQSSIHNANMLGAGLLARVAKLTENPEYLRAARSGMEYSCSRQLPDGSWWYAEQPKYHWIDNFHTGYNLNSLDIYLDATGDDEFRGHLDKGLAFYKSHFFEDTGRPKYYYTRTYPVDIQCAAQSIETLARFSQRDSVCRTLAKKVASWTIRNMQDPGGVLLLSAIPAHEGQDSDAPLGPGDHVQGTGGFVPAVLRTHPNSLTARLMIGVIAQPSENLAAREFFELFKTPWEFFRSGQRYDVLLCVRAEALPENAAKLVLIYGGRPLPFDVESGVDFQPSDTHALSYNGALIPIYGDSVTFRESPGRPVDEKFCDPAIFSRRSPEQILIRVGYSLFEEVRTLLAAGQPITNAAIPTLDLHIALLRDLILTAGIPLVEIPPVPHGYRFVVCLTHDVDHPLLHKHQFDHTMFGFLYRAITGSNWRVVPGADAPAGPAQQLDDGVEIAVCISGPRRRLLERLWAPLPKHREAIPLFFLCDSVQELSRRDVARSGAECPRRAVRRRRYHRTNSRIAGRRMRNRDSRNRRLAGSWPRPRGVAGDPEDHGSEGPRGSDALVVLE